MLADSVAVDRAGKIPALHTALCPAGGQTVPQHAQQGGGRTGAPARVRRLERNVVIHRRLHHHYLTARKRKLGKYTSMIGNTGSDNFIGRKLKTG
jgi:hypothetical protein